MLPSTLMPLSTEVSFELIDCKPAQLGRLCGKFNEHLQQIESSLSIVIMNRGNKFYISGLQAEAVERAKVVIQYLYQKLKNRDLVNNKTANKVHADEEINRDLIHQLLQMHQSQISIDDVAEEKMSNKSLAKQAYIQIKDVNFIKTPKKQIKLGNFNQISLVKSIENNTISFAVGPAGTGKTYIAVASAVCHLVSEKINKILLVRPVVEAGEKLGFLPGDLTEKIDPYLRPMYDALHEFLGFDQVKHFMAKNLIEIAPLAFMRGRTLNHTFAILDEAQNTTPAQMKMFLTRMGFNSKAVITGDVTQIDLPAKSVSGLIHAATILKGIEGIDFVSFGRKDIVRHPIIQSIVDAYDEG